jgi:hypothetical protein
MSTKKDSENSKDLQNLYNLRLSKECIIELGVIGLRKGYKPPAVKAAEEILENYIKKKTKPETVIAE